MNILIVAQYFPPDLGGAATRAYNIAKGLSLNGCNVTVVTAFPHYPHGKIPSEYKWTPLKSEQMDNFKVIRTLMPPIKSVGFFRRILLIGAFAVTSLFALPSIDKVDVVWASSWIPGIIYGKAKRRPIVLNMDDLKLEDLVDLGLLKEGSLIVQVAESVFRILLVKSNLVTPISPAYIQIISEKYCVRPNKINLVRGGVDLAIFKPDSLGKTGKKFTVLYSGGFSVAYDFELVFRAAKVVESLDGDIEFILQGKGEIVNTLHSRSKALNLKNLKIVDKLLSREEVGEMLSRADALILPLKFQKPYRGMSSKLYEYQAVGKPIICCGRGVPLSYVIDTNSGLVVDPGDYRALAKAVLHLKENPTLCRIMGENGRKCVEEESSIHAIGLRMKELCESIF